MKKLIFIFLILLPGMVMQAQDYRKDTTAVIILDRMSDLIGDMGSCSYRLSTSYDVIDIQLGLVKYFMHHNVYMVGPDKLLVYSNGEKGHRGFWYNGSQLTYYSFTENNYTIIDAPSNILSTIDTINETYGIEFPAVDFFYPAFTDDLINNFDDIIYNGKKLIEGKKYFQIIAKNASMGVQVWISDDEWFLPYKLVITYYAEVPNIQYEATFDSWQVNPDLPDAMFEFTPPPDATKFVLVPK